MPLVTPNGNREKVGVVVAIPAVPVEGDAVAAWIWEAVVDPTRPENEMSSWSVWAPESYAAVAKPIPGEAFAGDSSAPLNVAS